MGDLSWLTNPSGVAIVLKDDPRAESRAEFPSEPGESGNPDDFCRTSDVSLITAPEVGVGTETLGGGPMDLWGRVSKKEDLLFGEGLAPTETFSCLVRSDFADFPALPWSIMSLTGVGESDEAGSSATALGADPACLEIIFWN